MRAVENGNSRAKRFRKKLVAQGRKVYHSTHIKFIKKLLTKFLVVFACTQNCTFGRSQERNFTLICTKLRSTKQKGLSDLFPTYRISFCFYPLRSFIFKRAPAPWRVADDAVE